MKKQIVLVFCLFLSHWIIPGLSQDNKYARLNEDVTLSPVGGPGEVKSVVWKFGNDKVAEYDPVFDSNVSYYGPFMGRTMLDLTSGNITISKLTHQDEGKYSVEVNNKLLAKTFSLKPLENVGKPEINSSREGDQSILTCEGKATEYSDYSWLSADDVSLAAGDQLRVNKTGDPKRGYKCRLRNPVSEQTSNTVLEEDLFPTDPNPTAVAVGVITILALAALVTGVLLYKKGIILGRSRSTPPDNKGANGNAPGTGDDPGMIPVHSQSTPPDNTGANGNAPDTGDDPDDGTYVNVEPTS